MFRASFNFWVSKVQLLPLLQGFALRVVMMNIRSGLSGSLQGVFSASAGFLQVR